MSAAPRLAGRVPARVPAVPARTRPSLVVVPAGRPSASRAPFVAVVVSLLAAGLLGLLTLNTVLAQDAFTLHTLKTEGRELAEREQLLLREVELLRAPESLSAKATELGMVPAGPPAFLRLPDGAVLGEPAPGESPDPAAEPAP